MGRFGPVPNGGKLIKKIFLFIIAVTLCSSAFAQRTFTGGRKNIEAHNVIVNNELRFEETGTGSDKVKVKAPTALSDDYTLTLPADDGDANEFLQTNGSGTLDWAAAVSGSGTASYVTKWSDSNTLTDSVMYDDATNVGIGTTTPRGSYKLDVNGHIISSSNFYSEGGYYVFGDSTSDGEYLFNPSGTDDIAIVAGVNSRIYVNGTTGNVGIGTASPNTKLEVNGGHLTINNTQPTLRYTENDTADTNFLTRVNAGTFYIYEANDAFDSITERMKMVFGSHTSFMNANIGIGTATPTKELDVIGSVRAVSPLVDATYGGYFEGYYGVIGKTLRVGNSIVFQGSAYDGDLMFRVGTDGSNQPYLNLMKNGGSIIGVHLDSTGDSYFNGSDVKISGTQGKMLELSADAVGTFKMGVHTGEYFSIGHDATQAFNIDNIGKVGIGTTSPNQKLEVDGSILTDSLLYFTGGDHTADDWHVGIAAGGLRFTETGVSDNRLMLLDGGNVGIGTVTPDTTLQVVGSAKLGDDNTNYASFASDGELTLTGTARVNKEFSLLLTDFNPGASGPTKALNGIYPTYEFTIDDDMYTSFEMPDDWAVGTDITVEVYWAIDEAYVTNSGEVRWSADWRAIAVGEVISGGSSGTMDFGDVNIHATANTVVKTTSTISGASLAADDLVAFNGARVDLVAGNNPTAEPYIIAVRLEYIADKLGEAT